MVKKYIVVLVAAILMWACNPPKTEDNRMTEEELVKILVDIHLTDASLSSKNIYTKRNDYKPSYYYNSIYEKYGITQEQFDSTINFYALDNVHFSQIYEKVIDSLNRLETKLKIKLKNMPDSRDTINLWPRKPELTLKGKIARNLKFTIPVKEKGFYTIKAEIKIQKDDESIDPKIIAYFWKYNGNKNGEKLDFEPVPLVKDGKFHTYTTQLELTDSTFKMLKGDLFNFSNEENDFKQNIEIRDILIFNPRIRNKRLHRSLRDEIRD